MKGRNELSKVVNGIIGLHAVPDHNNYGDCMFILYKLGSYGYFQLSQDFL